MTSFESERKGMTQSLMLKFMKLTVSEKTRVAKKLQVFDNLDSNVPQLGWAQRILTRVINQNKIGELEKELQ